MASKKKDRDHAEPITGPLINLTPAQERWLEQETQKKLADWKAELAEQLKAKEDVIARAATDDELARQITTARLDAQVRTARLERYSDEWKACWLAIYLDDKVDEARLARTMMGDFAT